MQLIVLGAHRSGTSMVTRLVSLMSASLGPSEYILNADDWNPTGYWERADVSGINESLLRAAGSSWDRAADFDVRNVPAGELRLFRDRAAAIVANLNAVRPWVMKDPRLCILLPLWRPLLNHPIGICIYRNPLDVAASLHARDKIPLSQGLDLWETYTRSALAVANDLPLVVVSYETLVSTPAAAVRDLFDELTRLGAKGLRWPGEEALLRFVDPELRHHHASENDAHAAISGRHLEFYESLKSGLMARQPSRF